MAKEIVFIVNDHKVGGVSTFLKTFDVDHRVVSLSNAKFSFWPVKLLYAILLCYKIKPSTVILNEDLPSLLIIFLVGKRKIVFLHKNPDYIYKSKFWYYYYRFVSRYYRVSWYGVSKSQSKSISKIINRKVQTRFTLYDVNYLEIEYCSRCINFLYWGRVVEGKGILELALLLSKISHLIDKKLVLNIIGPIDDKGLFSKVQYLSTISIETHGVRNLTYLAGLESLCAISLSDSEGFGLANYELLGLGVPCLIKDVNYGPSELLNKKLKEGEIGSFLIDRNYQINEIIGYLGLIFSNRETYENARLKSRKQWEDFNHSAHNHNKNQII
jgi:hypothetical protein